MAFTSHAVPQWTRLNSWVPSDRLPLLLCLRRSFMGLTSYVQLRGYGRPRHVHHAEALLLAEEPRIVHRV